MNKEDTLKQICKMISSGDIPKGVYDKYLSKTPLGFMNYEELYDFLNEQNKKHKEVIDKAIEYIKKDSWHYTYEDDCDIYLCESELEELLEILKGNDSNE